jgi:peptidoglycan/LPS O-acetylase OafA/YrhL
MQNFARQLQAIVFGPTSAAGSSGQGFDGHYRVLDSYRFLAASLVCIYHFNKDNVLGLNTISPLFHQFRLGVDFFFVLSGFVIARTYLGRINSLNDYKMFMWKRFARLYPLHLITLLIGIIGGMVIGHRALQAGTNSEIFSSTAIIANLTLTHSLGITNYGSFNIPSWSISAEMFVYLLFPLFAFLITRLPALVNGALIIAYVGITILVREHLGLRDWTLTWYDWGALRAIPTFFAGILIAQLLSTRFRNFAPSIWWAHAAFVLTLVPMHFVMRDEFVLFGFVMVVLLAAAAEQNGAKSKLQHGVCVHLGNASFSLYMWHMPIKVAIFAIIGKLLGITLLPMWGAALLSYFASLIVALLCYRYLEIPSRDAILAWVRKEPAPLRTRHIRDLRRAP